mmetsp:Transcript_8609/g.13205  ORF Transcript_8609/g.13205 Transcript_8609/m.13205 type:complete len:93 (+) Transcript_8609:168-446(+)
MKLYFFSIILVLFAHVGCVAMVQSSLSDEGEKDNFFYMDQTRKGSQQVSKTGILENRAAEKFGAEKNEKGAFQTMTDLFGGFYSGEVNSIFS